MDNVFNAQSRKRNMQKTFFGYGLSYVLNTIGIFIYRTVFIRILTKEYLGIEGLFTNVIQILSFAELGIGEIIAYRLYEPIKNNDVKSVAEFMKLYKMIYRVIACVIAGAGLFFFYCLDLLIKDTSEIPDGIQIECIYLLFLVQCVSSYFFSYRQTLLAADQRGGYLAFCHCGKMLFQYTGQIALLLLTRNYTVMMAGSIIITVLYNAAVSGIIWKLYEQVFRFPCKTPYNLLRPLAKDVKAMLFHRIGGTVINSTDNIIMSAYIGLGTLGKYANYSLIIGSLESMFGKVLGNFNGSIGNAHVTLSKKERYSLYRKLHFINLWIASVASVCLYALIDPFIIWWQGDAMAFGSMESLIMVIHFYLVMTRFVNISYVNACGLFSRDLGRPLIEAVVNLSVSIVLAGHLGITGVIFGTIISNLLTVWWREPYLLYKYEFGAPLLEYWTVYIKFICVTFGFCYFVKASDVFSTAGFWGICRNGIFLFSVCNIVLIIINIRNKDFLSFFTNKRRT